MTTDTAMGVTKRVVEDGLHLNLEKKEGEQLEEESGPSIVWVNTPELKFGGGESVSTAALVSKESTLTLAFKQSQSPHLSVMRSSPTSIPTELDVSLLCS